MDSQSIRKLQRKNSPDNIHSLRSEKGFDFKSSKLLYETDENVILEDEKEEED